MSGSGAYYIDGGERFVHAVAHGRSPTSYTKMWSLFSGELAQLIASARGGTLDIQPLDCNGSKPKVAPGGMLNMTHLSTNPTNHDPGAQTYTFTWYLSDNDEITTADTPLSIRSVVYDHAAMGAATFVSNGIQIPSNTPHGTYWLGVIYDAGTDGAPENNTTNYWDAYKLVVGAVIGS
jgi:hypothetical protein